MTERAAQGTKGKVVDVRDAVALVPDGATIVIGGSGAGHALPQRFIDELADVFTAEGRPRDLTTGSNAFVSSMTKRVCILPTAFSTRPLA